MADWSVISTTWLLFRRLNISFSVRVFVSRKSGLILCAGHWICGDNFLCFSLCSEMHHRRSFPSSSHWLFVVSSIHTHFFATASFRSFRPPTSFPSHVAGSFSAFPDSWQTPVDYLRRFQVLFRSAGVVQASWAFLSAKSEEREKGSLSLSHRLVISMKWNRNEVYHW